MQNLQNSSLHCFRTNLEHLERYFSITVDDGKKFSERVTAIEREFYGKESVVVGPVSKLRHIYLELNRRHAIDSLKNEKKEQ